MTEKDKIPIIPGRGINTSTAYKLRHDYLQNNGFATNKIDQHNFTQSDINNNIESFIGSIELPLGIVGPLLNKKNEELLYCPAGTLEGALIASMNRGAKAISNSGGFEAEIIHQKMTRSPLFIFKKMSDGLIFKRWINKNTKNIKGIAEKYSNHASLQNITSFIIGKSVHLKFSYTTGDASGQNMTTTCTWHAMLWIVEKFQFEKNIEILHFVIEGNGSSDKKVSHSSFYEGRGIHVAAECFLREEHINKILRTTSDDIYACFAPSLAMSKIDGMMGYNINVANAIAAIFVATGQDLGSLHESSNGILSLEKTEDGLYMALNLPTLVVGTIGGGTHLPKQQEALKIMKCYGNGKVERFAKMIAGFALALEISTYSAIVSGEFAKAHEKLGRNKPVNWLKKSDINTEFIKKIINEDAVKVSSVQISEGEMIENGILTDLTKKVNNKLIGFIPVTVAYEDSSTKQLLIKSKALDIEVIKGLHIMAASIDPELSDLINKHKENLEYAFCHKKEIGLYEQISGAGFRWIPNYYGKYINKKNETWLFLQEFLYFGEMQIYNSENHPENWSPKNICSVIKCITEIHQHLKSASIQNKLNKIKEFKPWQSAKLYIKMVSIMYKEADDNKKREEYASMLKFIDELEFEHNKIDIPKTIVHNDFNSRNIAIRKNGDVCIYDWELAVINFPHRDIIEFLSFVLKPDFSKKELFNYLKYHYDLNKESNINWEHWLSAYKYAIKEYLVTRVSFYDVSGILIKFPFSERIREVSFKILKYID